MNFFGLPGGVGNDVSDLRVPAFPFGSSGLKPPLPNRIVPNTVCWISESAGSAPATGELNLNPLWKVPNLSFRASPWIFVAEASASKQNRPEYRLLDFGVGGLCPRHREV